MVSPATQSSQRTPVHGLRAWFSWPLVIVVLPVVVVMALVWLVVVALVWSVLVISLLTIVWTTWWPRGRYALVVYSNSPIWQQYFEERMLPAIGKRGVVLNWSERKRWKLSLSVALFRTFAGGREFNPLVIVFEPLKRPRRFQFLRPFRAFTQGRPEQVEEMRAELLRLLDRW